MQFLQHPFLQTCPHLPPLPASPPQQLHLAPQREPAHAAPPLEFAQLVEVDQVLQQPVGAWQISPKLLDSGSQGLLIPLGPRLKYEFSEIAVVPLYGFSESGAPFGGEVLGEGVEGPGVVVFGEVEEDVEFAEDAGGQLLPQVGRLGEGAVGELVVEAGHEAAEVQLAQDAALGVVEVGRRGWGGWRERGDLQGLGCRFLPFPILLHGRRGFPLGPGRR